jgi:hypothetical protein
VLIERKAPKVQDMNPELLGSLGSAEDACLKVASDCLREQGEEVNLEHSRTSGKWPHRIP